MKAIARIAVVFLFSMLIWGCSSLSLTTGPNDVIRFSAKCSAPSHFIVYLNDKVKFALIRQERPLPKAIRCVNGALEVSDVR